MNLSREKAAEDLQLLEAYFLANIDYCLKPANDYLPYPFIDPGSIYDGNLWDWDTYWAAYGLLSLFRKAEHAEKKGRVLLHAQGNVLNFLHYQLDDGYIPMMVEKTDLPEPYLLMKHKEGVLMNMHKPFLCQQALMVCQNGLGFDWMQPHLPQLEKYFACYRRDYFNSNCQLYVWADDVMIGMDNDPASFGRPRFSTANIFLNSFMVSELQAMAEILARLGQPQGAARYLKESEELVQAIRTEMWDKRDRFFYSADVDIKTRAFDWFHVGLGVFWKTLPIKIRTWSGFLPMSQGFATTDEAAFLRGHSLDPSTFASPYGPRTLAADEKMYNLSATNNPSNWLGPIWLIANYLVFRGLLKYGYKDDAGQLMMQTASLLADDLRRTGCLHEYYVPETGEPVMNPGFMNWNMLIVSMAEELSAHGG